jgi:hypothetical protein
MLSKLKASMPWLTLFAFLLLPLYAISAAFVIRSGVFNLEDRSISPDEYKALWAFIASGLATAATVVGLLFTRAQNQRTSNQLALDTAVKSLELLVVGEGQYAPKARIAGALAALVHLGHPTIAMRTLASIWSDKAVDSRAACWLIGEVLTTGSDESKTEAAELLELHIDKLTEAAKWHFYWPSTIYERWPTDAPIDARVSVLFALGELLASRPKHWWEGRETWAFALFDEARLRDPEPTIQNTAALILRSLVPEGSRDLDLVIDWGKGNKNIQSIAHGATNHRGVAYYAGAEELGYRLEHWTQGTEETSGQADAGGRRRRPPAGRP